MIARLAAVHQSRKVAPVGHESNSTLGASRFPDRLQSEERLRPRVWARRGGSGALARRRGWTLSSASSSSSPSGSSSSSSSSKSSSDSSLAKSSSSSSSGSSGGPPPRDARLTERSRPALAVFSARARSGQRLPTESREGYDRPRPRHWRRCALYVLQDPGSWPLPWQAGPHGAHRETRARRGAERLTVPHVVAVSVHVCQGCCHHGLSLQSTR